MNSKHLHDKPISGLIGVKPIVVNLSEIYKVVEILNVGVGNIGWEYL